MEKEKELNKELLNGGAYLKQTNSKVFQFYQKYVDTFPKTFGFPLTFNSFAERLKNDSNIGFGNKPYNTVSEIKNELIIEMYLGTPDYRKKVIETWTKVESLYKETRDKIKDMKRSL